MGTRNRLLKSKPRTVSIMWSKGVKILDHASHCGSHNSKPSEGYEFFYGEKISFFSFYLFMHFGHK